MVGHPEVISDSGNERSVSPEPHVGRALDLEKRYPQSSLLYKHSRQRHHGPMLADSVIELIASLIRTLLIEELVERVRKLRPDRQLHGMSAVRSHVQGANRRRLLNRLSTDDQ